MNKTFRDNLITYGMVIAAYVIMQILVSAGAVSSLLQGLLVPLCTYAILAVSLNLTVGILGELSSVMPDLCVSVPLPVLFSPKSWKILQCLPGFAFSSRY